MGNSISRENKLNISAVLLASLAVLCFPQVLNLQEGTLGFTNSFFSVLVWLFCVLALKNIMHKVDWQDRRGLVLSGVWAFFFTGALLFGTRLEAEENVNFKDWKLWISWLILTCFFGLLVRHIFGLLEECAKRNTVDAASPSLKWQSNIIVFLFLFFCWFVVFLAVYPGFFVYDAQDEYVQVATRSFSTHHPLLHVILLGGIVCGVHKFTGSYNLGIACYTILQMLFAAGVLTGVLAYLRKKNVSRRLWFVSVLYFALFPVIVMFIVCSAKDAIFTLAFLVLLLSILHLGQNPKYFFTSKKSILCFLASAVVMMLFRPNGIYAFVLMIPILLIWQRKYLKKLALLLGIALVINFVVNMTLVMVLHADTSENQELLTVPIQQLARTYQLNRDAFTEEDISILYEILPDEVLSRYRPRLSDPVKYYFNNEAYKADPVRYISLWARIGLRKPLTYINAWLMNSYGFWYPDTVVDVYRGNPVFTFTYQDSSYFGYEVEQPGVRESKLPWLAEWYRKLSLEIYKEKVPVLSMLFSPGFVFWFFAFVTWYLWYRRRYEVLLPNILVWFLYLTVLFGPTYLPRYVLIFWFGLPLFVILLMEKKSQ